MSPDSGGFDHAWQLEPRDGSVGTFLGVHAGLATHIHMHGAEEQKQRWLPLQWPLRKWPPKLSRVSR